jgi:serine/threonine protein kinase
MRKYLPDPVFFIGKPVPGLSDYTIKELIKSGNDAHLFRSHSEKIKNNLACKIIPLENLLGKDLDPPLWRQEIEKAQALRSPMAVKFTYMAEWKDPDNNIDCMVLCAEYVDGSNLRDHLKKKEFSITVAFIEKFLLEMLSFIHDMEKNNVQHGDLHGGNILVEDRTALLGGEPYAFRVTDFGVRSATSSDARFKDDYEQLAFELRELLQKIDYQQLSSRDRFVYNFLKDQFLVRYLCEKDRTREPHARDTHALYEMLRGIDNEYQVRLENEAQSRLLTPFDYSSCEQIGESHSLLKALYSDCFLGLEIIRSRNNLVLTGPRGCGKTTVFKSLSLRHRYLVENDNPKSVEYIGIYYQCYDLYSAFPRYRLPERQEAYDIPMHYLTATLIIEMLEILEMWATRYFEGEFRKQESHVSSKIWDAMSLERPQVPGVNSFKVICSRLQKQRLRARNKQRFVHKTDVPIECYFGPDVLIEVCKVLMSSFPFLHNRPFYFFIDDYSIPKVSKAIQENLNRLLMQRNPNAFFKLSTESPVSYLRSDIDGKAYVEGREFELLNLGLVYLYANNEEKSRFIEDIFSRRFDAIPGYPVKNLDQLIGSYCPPSDNEVAIIIRTREKRELWGRHILCELCSGDIFYIIRLVGTMVSKVGDRDGLSNITDSPGVEKNIQRDAIRNEAGNFLNSLRGIEDGERLAEVVTAFGNVAHSYLKFRTSKNEKNRPPHQASRIEPLEELKLNPEAQKIYDNLLRYSLFIEDPRGKSRRGKVVPRLYLRRSLLPHFNLTFSKRDSISLENREIEHLLLKPGEFEMHKKIKKEQIEDTDSRQNKELPFPKEDV